MSGPIYLGDNDRPRVRIVSTRTGAYPIRVEGLGDAMVREVRINPIKAGEPITAWVEVFDVDVDLDLDPKIRLVGLADMEAASVTTTVGGAPVDREDGEYVAEVVVRVVVSPHTIGAREGELRAVTEAVRSLCADLTLGKYGVPGEPGAVYTQRFEVQPARIAP